MARARARGCVARAARPPHALDGARPCAADERRHGRARSRRGSANARARPRADALLRRRLVHRRRGRRGVCRARLRRLHAAGARDRRTCARASAGRRSPRRRSSSCRRAARSRAIPTTHSLGDLARALPRRDLPELVHVYFHDTDLLDARRRALLRVVLPAARAPRTGRPTSTRSPRARSRTRRASRGTTWRGSNIHGMSGPKVAPPAETVTSGADAARAASATSAPRGSTCSRAGSILSRRPARRSRSSALVVLDVVGPRARDLPRARHPPGRHRRRRRPLGPPLARRAGGVAQVRRADHGPRLRAGGPLPAARAAAGRGADPRLPHRRRAHRARVRDRDGLRLLDLGPHPDVRRRLGGDDRPPARRVRVGLARGHARGRDPAPRRARRRRREPRAPARVARVGAQRAHVRVRRRRRARGRSRVPSSSGRAPSSRSCSTRSSPTS